MSPKLSVCPRCEKAARTAVGVSTLLPRLELFSWEVGSEQTARASSGQDGWEKAMELFMWLWSAV